MAFFSVIESEIQNCSVIEGPSHHSLLSHSGFNIVNFPPEDMLQFTKISHVGVLAPWLEHSEGEMLLALVELMLEKQM